MICYPGYHGLPPWEPAREILEGNYETQVVISEQYDYLEEKNTSLWWAGKELIRGKVLSDYCGKNEKTKIVRSRCYLDCASAKDWRRRASPRAGGGRRNPEKDDGLLLQEAAGAEGAGKQRRRPLPKSALGES